MEKHLTFKDDKSDKFWRIAAAGKEFTVTYGKTGTSGTSQTKTFASEDECQKEAKKLLGQKLKKGYVEGDAKPTPTAKTELIPLGYIANNYSNYLNTVAVDAPYASYWGKDDWERIDEEDELKIGQGTGIGIDVGGCGSSTIYRLGDAIVFVEFYSGEDDAESEAQLERAIAMTPTYKAEKLGSIKIDSGVLALLNVYETGKVSEQALATARKKGVKDLELGLLVALPKGKYEIWQENFPNEIEGNFGIISSRIRIVPAGTPVIEGQPIAELAPPAPKPKSVDGIRRLIPEWGAVGSFDVAPDGRAFAGEKGAYRVCAWDPEGSLLWQHELRDPMQKHLQMGRAWVERVQLVNDHLLVLAHGTKESGLYVLDLATGNILARHNVPRWIRGFAVSPDHKWLILRVSTDPTLVFRYPTLEKIAEFNEYCREGDIAVSSDSKKFAIVDDEAHLYDLDQLSHIATIESGEGRCIAFLPNGTLAVGDENAQIKIYDLTGKCLLEVDAAPERKRKPTISTISADGERIAVGRDDGAVVVFDLQLRPIATLAGHYVTLPGTGAESLAAVKLCGGRLWVSAGKKKQPVGLSVYEL